MDHFLSNLSGIRGATVDSRPWSSPALVFAVLSSVFGSEGLKTCFELVTAVRAKAGFRVEKCKTADKSSDAVTFNGVASILSFLSVRNFLPTIKKSCLRRMDPKKTKEGLADLSVFCEKENVNKLK